MKFISGDLFPTLTEKDQRSIKRVNDHLKFYYENKWNFRSDFTLRESMNLTFTNLGQGYTRTCFSVSDNVVVKVEHRGFGKATDELEDQNNTEYQVWEALKYHKFNKFLCPLVGAVQDGTSYYVALYFLKATIKPRSAEPLASFCKRLEGELSVRERELFPVHDIHNGNVGFLSGEAVLIDYGVAHHAAIAALK